jgi:hypothetical protein
MTGNRLGKSVSFAFADMILKTKTSSASSASQGKMAYTYLYHATPRKNLESILKEGLLPQKGDSSSRMKNTKGVYFFTEFAPTKLLANAEENRKDNVILVIDRKQVHGLKSDSGFAERISDDWEATYWKNYKGTKDKSNAIPPKKHTLFTKAQQSFYTTNPVPNSAIIRVLNLDGSVYKDVSTISPSGEKITDTHPEQPRVSPKHHDLSQVYGQPDIRCLGMREPVQVSIISGWKSIELKTYPEGGSGNFKIHLRFVFIPSVSDVTAEYGDEIHNFSGNVYLVTKDGTFFIVDKKRPPKFLSIEDNGIYSPERPISEIWGSLVFPTFLKSKLFDLPSLYSHSSMEKQYVRYVKDSEGNPKKDSNGLPITEPDVFKQLEPGSESLKLWRPQAHYKEAVGTVSDWPQPSEEQLEQLEQYYKKVKKAPSTTDSLLPETIKIIRFLESLGCKRNTLAGDDPDTPQGDYSTNNEAYANFGFKDPDEWPGEYGYFVVSDKKSKKGGSYWSYMGIPTKVGYDLASLEEFVKRMSTKKKASVDIHESPTKLPPRNDLRRHLDKDALEEDEEPEMRHLISCLVVAEKEI